MKRLFNWLSVYNSPFKPPIPRLHIGRVKVGVPYFYPRKSVNHTTKSAREFLKDESVYNPYRLIDSMTEEEKIKAVKERYYRFVPKKIGFDFVPLGWKTKWGDTDYRFEYPPVWSFVLFGLQIAVVFNAPYEYHFWECWLYYSRNTSGRKKDRVKQAKEEYPCTWKSTRQGKLEIIDYWNLVLKKKYNR